MPKMRAMECTPLLAASGSASMANEWAVRKKEHPPWRLAEANAARLVQATDNPDSPLPCSQRPRLFYAPKHPLRRPPATPKKLLAGGSFCTPKGHYWMLIDKISLQNFWNMTPQDRAPQLRRALQSAAEPHHPEIRSGTRPNREVPSLQAAAAPGHLKL